MDGGVVCRLTDGQKFMSFHGGQTTDGHWYAPRLLETKEDRWTSTLPLSLAHTDRERFLPSQESFS